jgi:hypothetical protein
MLAGLIFAVQDADDRPGMLAATLPFAGLTVIEYQARLLIAAGASQIVIVVSRLTPELLGAIARIGRRGVTVDNVRSAGEASARLHPLAHLLVLADGLVTTDAVVASIAREEGDALLVVPESEADAGYELIGGGDAWAGIARLDGLRLANVAAMPRDYDIQSSLLHVAAQAGAMRLVLPEGEQRIGHGIERRGDSLELRSRAVVSSSLATRTGWFDRWIVRPFARIGLPALMRRQLPTTALAGAAGALGLAGWASLWTGHLTVGLISALVALVVAKLAGSFARLRDEAVVAQAMTWLTAGVPAVSALLLGRAVDSETGELTGVVLAIASVVAGALGERAAPSDRPQWCGDPAAYLTVLATVTILGFPTIALGAVAVYAAVTVAAAIELLRKRL